MNFGIRAETFEGGVSLVALSGEVDLYTAPEFKRELISAIDNGAEFVVVDMTDATFIDSTTLGVLLGGLKRIRSRDGELSLVITERNIKKVFEITGLDKVFPVHSTVTEAVDRFKVGA